MAEELRPEGFYWIKRTEPDGPPKWEPALFRHHHPLPGGPPVPDGGPCWYVIGSPYPQREITTLGASNRWRIGPRVEMDWEHMERVARYNDWELTRALESSCNR